MSLTARDRAVMRDMARLMEGPPLGEGKIYWDQTPQGALYWNEVYCNLLSLAKDPADAEGPTRVEYVTTCSGRHLCVAPTDESHECQRDTYSHAAPKLSVVSTFCDYHKKREGLNTTPILPLEVDE